MYEKIRELYIKYTKEVRKWYSWSQVTRPETHLRGIAEETARLLREALREGKAGYRAEVHLQEAAERLERGHDDLSGALWDSDMPEASKAAVGQFLTDNFSQALSDGIALLEQVYMKETGRSLDEEVQGE